MAAVINELVVDTPRGDRTVRLVHGSIAEIEADLRIVSTHANVGFRPSGGALRALGFECGLDSDHLEPLLLLQPNEVFGTWRIRSSSDLLVLRMPGAEHIAGGPDAQLDVYERAVFVVYASLAALELADRGYERVACTLFGGRRGYPERDAMKILLTQASRWMQRARTTRRIDLVEPDEAKLETWTQAMDEALGRAAYDIANDSAVAALADELLARLDPAPFEEAELVDKVAVPLLDALSPANRRRLRVARLSIAGRVLAESLVTRLEKAHSFKKTSAGDLHGRIDRLLHAGLEPWIAQHLHALRVYGNEEVHFKGKDRRLERRDLPGILASLLRIVVFWHDLR